MDYTTYIFKSTFISVYIKLFWIYQSSFASIRNVIQTKLHFWTVLLLWSPTAICNKKTRLVWMIFFFTSLWSLDNHNSRTDRFCIILLKYISSLTFVKYLDFLHYFNIIIIMILKLRSTVAETDITSFKVCNKLYNIIKYIGYRFLF